MNSRIVRRDRALRDLEDRSEYIRQHNPRSGLRFVDAAEATFKRLAAMPGIGTRYDPDNPAFGDRRFFPITRFKQDLVYYRPMADGIEVIRVLHGARDIQGILEEESGSDQGDEGKQEGP